MKKSLCEAEGEKGCICNLEQLCGCLWEIPVFPSLLPLFFFNRCSDVLHVLHVLRACLSLLVSWVAIVERGGGEGTRTVESWCCPAGNYTCPSSRRNSGEERESFCLGGDVQREKSGVGTRTAPILVPTLELLFGYWRGGMITTLTHDTFPHIRFVCAREWIWDDILIYKNWIDPNRVYVSVLWICSRGIWAHCAHIPTYVIIRAGQGHAETSLLLLSPPLPRPSLATEIPNGGGMPLQQWPSFVSC